MMMHYPASQKRYTVFLVYRIVKISIAKTNIVFQLAKIKNYTKEAEKSTTSATGLQPMNQLSYFTPMNYFYSKIYQYYGKWHLFTKKNLRQFHKVKKTLFIEKT